MNHSIYTITFLLLHHICGHNCGVDQVGQILTAQEGDSVFLPCLVFDDQLYLVMWYKQVLGEKPVPIVSSYHPSQPNKFSYDFKENQRFHAERKTDSFNLTIRRTLKSDSGMYFCGFAFVYTVSFETGMILLVKGEDLKNAVIQNPVRAVIKPGSNVTLQCSVQGKMFDKGVQPVYWLRQRSNMINPGTVSGEMKNECATFSNTQRCLYNLINVAFSDAGVYYCAVITSDEVLFGYGATLVIEDGFNIESTQNLVLIGLVVLCAVSFAINICLCFPLRRKGGTPQQIQTDDTITRVQFHTIDDINYAALNLSTKRGQRKRTLEETPF